MPAPAAGRARLRPSAARFAFVLATWNGVRPTALSLLTSVGLPWLAVEGVDAYVALAAKSAADPAGLQQMRREMRQRVAQSPLCDAVRLTRAIEVEYQQMFRAWAQSAAA